MKVILPINVVAFETDYGGVVSNTRYLEYVERGRYALFHAAGFRMEEYTATAIFARPIAPSTGISVLRLTAFCQQCSAPENQAPLNSGFPDESSR